MKFTKTHLIKTMDYQKQRELYVAAAHCHLHDYDCEYYSQHILDIVVSVMMHRDGVMKGGGFVEAVCNNDLRGALARADDECKQYLGVIALAHPYAFIEQLNYN